MRTAWERGAQPPVDADDAHHGPLAGGDLDLLGGEPELGADEFEGTLVEQFAGGHDVAQQEPRVQVAPASVGALHARGDDHVLVQHRIACAGLVVQIDGGQQPRFGPLLGHTAWAGAHREGVVLDPGEGLGAGLGQGLKDGAAYLGTAEREQQGEFLVGEGEVVAGHGAALRAAAGGQVPAELGAVRGGAVVLGLEGARGTAHPHLSRLGLRQRAAQLLTDVLQDLLDLLIEWGEFGQGRNGRP